MYNSLTENPFSRGVAILLRKNSDIKVVNWHSDKEGRLVMINVEIENEYYTFVSLYAPNDEYCRKTFYRYAIHWIREHTINETNLIVAGDYNSYCI